MIIQIKIFEHIHFTDEHAHFEEIEQLVNNFLRTLPQQNVVSVNYAYLPLGNTKRPGVTRCTGYVIYKT